MILLVTPTEAGSVHGNGVTARRWAGLLRELGYPVRVSQRYDGGNYAALLALHARKSADAIRSFHANQPTAPVVIAMTGTDLYPDPAAAGVDPAVLAMASRLIVLQPLALRQLDRNMAARTRVIVQSVAPVPRLPHRTDCFEIAFLAHVRPVKDPLLLAAAVRLLPAGSRIRVTHAGEARDPALAADVAAESIRNPRYDWLGPIPREGALAMLARCHLLALTSRHEGGANVISEAIAAAVPVIASRIPGSIGLLGADYPGYFPVGDAAALADRLLAAEQDRNGYCRALQAHCNALRSLVDPARERQAFAALMNEIGLRAPA